jgi:peptidoglycan/LPS O-acetylase OafA/YrhL
MLLGKLAGTPPLSSTSRNLLKIIDNGHFAISVFIVLSGYVLMLPVLRCTDGSLKGGLSGFFKRRAKRILPTYYTALFLFSGAIYFTHLLYPNIDIAPVHPVDFITHLFLVHNLSPSTVNTIDAPMWSLATEWQIYFVFAILLLPIYRRFGIYIAMLTSFILGLTPHFTLPPAANLDWACPWYLGLFSCGMFAACVGFGALRHWEHLRSHAPWGITAFGGLLTFIFCGYGPLPQKFKFFG